VTCHDFHSIKKSMYLQHGIKAAWGLGPTLNFYLIKEGVKKELRLANFVCFK
jgi:hypothetical protein